MNLLIEPSKEKTKLPGVMRAALKLFVRKGIHGTTIKDIAREAGVAEGALYRHFKSKEELAWHLFQVPLEQFTRELDAMVFVQPSSRERIRVFVEESFKAFEEDRELYTYLIVNEHNELEKYAKFYSHPGRTVLRIIEDGQKRGEIRTGEALILGSLFVGGVIRVCVVKKYGRLKGDLKNHSADVAEMIWEMLKMA
jgi:AcrR family transcriptional regulator